MRRIGITASRMAQGNWVRYNLFVIGISMLCASILFVVSSISVLVALSLVFLVLRFFLPLAAVDVWLMVVKIVLSTLAVIIGLLNALAIIKNVRFTRPKL